MLERMIKPSYLQVISVIAIYGGLFVGCAKDDDDGDGQAQTAAELTSAGWVKFESGDYVAAAANFQSAVDRNANYSDAYNGLGWTTGRIQSRLNESGGYFARSLALDTTRYDALGGWAFAVYQEGRWGSALSKADSLLRRRPGWRFLHEPTLDFRDMWLMVAAANYNLADYAAAYRAIVEHLNAGFETDINTPAGRRELLEEIERLRRIYG